MQLKLTALLATALACALAVGAATAQAASPAEARQTLEEVEALLDRGRTDPVPFSAGSGPQDHGRDHATLLLLRLQQSLPALSPAERQRARKLFARPGKGAFDSFRKEAARSPVCDANFCVHWSRNKRAAPRKADRAPANGIPDFVDSIAAAAAHSYDVQNGVLGWRKPMSDGLKGSRKGKGRDGQTDIYVDSLGRGLFGYAATDRGRTPKRQPGFLVVDNDYEGFNGKPVDLMRATMAHEYNHVVQFAYNLRLDAWMFESTATWMEEHVYPGINDYVNFLKPSIQRPDAPLAELNRWAFKLYGSAIWNHYLDHTYGPDVMRRAWEAGTRVRPEGFAVAAFESAIKGAGGAGFSQDFVRFAAATAEWRSTNVFPDPLLYRDIARSGALKRSATGKLDHTGYRLLRIQRPADGDVVLRVKFKRGARSGIALVGREGPRSAGTVTTESAYLPNGGKATVTLPDAGRFARITAVVVNADGRIKGKGRRYRADRASYRLSLR